LKKIIITTSSFNLDNFTDLPLLQRSGFEVMLNPFSRRLKESEVSELLDDDVVGIIAGVEPLTRRVLSGLKSLRVIARCGIGLDSVDLDAAKEYGIDVSNTPDAPTLPVAELTLAHMLNLLRKVSSADRLVRAGNWTPLMGELLSGKIVGVIGLGRIGKKVAELVTAFGAHVVSYDISNIKSDGAIRLVGLNELLALSDIVTLHVPLTTQTSNLIGKTELQTMKTGAYLLNISRGGLVDENALYHAVNEGKLSGAGMDSFSDEPYNGPLCELENVVLTAHMGSYAKEARKIQEQEASKNLVSAMIEMNLLS
jgi:D-3-phosphoglycerate dehydrogenase